jgi:hypothetical protein
MNMTLQTQFIDDIDAGDWLREIDMEQYEDVFVTNFSIGGKLLSRRRLGNLRLQDFPKLNIQIYDHQKILMEHIRHTLCYTFHSPVRRKEARDKFILRSPNAKPPPEPEPKYVGVVKEKKESKRGKRQTVRTKRRSFDNAAWNKINALRSKDIVSHNAADELRKGIKPTVVKKKEKEGHLKMRARRYSFGEATPMDQLTSVQKGNLYGNMALEYDMIQKEMAMIKAEHLLVFQALINCESGRLYFVSEHAREMIVLIGHEWYRESMDSDIAGHCAQTGRVMNIPNAYDDHRFNRNVDTMTGFKTKNLLCMPIRANRGGGRIIGVVQMANKLGKEGKDSSIPFDDADEQILGDCVQRIADDIHLRFQELMHAAEALTGASTFIAEGSRERQGQNHTAATAASKGAQRQVYDGKDADLTELHSVHGHKMVYGDDVLAMSEHASKDRRRQDYGGNLQDRDVKKQLKKNEEADAKANADVEANVEAKAESKQ